MKKEREREERRERKKIGKIIIFRENGTKRNNIEVKMRNT